MAQKKKQLVAEGKLDKHGRPNENTPKEYLRSLPDVSPAKVRVYFCHVEAHMTSHYSVYCFIQVLHAAAA